MKITTVCSHNRTRSVMTAAMLQSMLDDRFGPSVAIVDSLGFGPEGLPSIPDAVDAMKRRGLDTASHLSRQVTAARIDAADLVLTSERDHVIKIAGVSPAAYRQSMTLPEFLASAEWEHPNDDDTLRSWMTSLTAHRTAREYLTSSVDEIIDPTGLPQRLFESAVVEMQAQCERVVDILSRLSRPPS